jgi:2-polyprenyl-3-methyl-5-hydroxy-6-metoxy-1,4-benzoquinol methylase
MKKTKEKQYSYLLELEERKLGLMMNRVWDNDPRRLAFVLARYKFVSKMFQGFEEVLEGGCGDAWPSRIVAQSVSNLTVSDFDPIFIEDAKSRHEEKWKMDYLVHNLVEIPTSKKFDGIFLCDVFEHIDPLQESIFLENSVKSLNENGSMIIGIPSLESQAIIAPENRDPGHVNCKNGMELKLTLEDYFSNVFLFSMNDEVVHTGHHKMAHYIFCLCCSPKSF